MRQPTPELAGFVDAQQRLRDHLGAEIIFYDEPVVTFPPGTPIDPETGVPFDPTVAGSAAAQASAAAQCSVAWGVQGKQILQSAAGVDDVTQVVLITASANAAPLASASEFDWNSERYAITAQKPDIRWQARWLIFGRRK